MAHQQQVAGPVSPERRRKWLDAVEDAVAAGELSCSAFMLAHVIALRFLNGKSGVAWPTQQTLGGRLNLGERQIRTLLHGLEAAKFIHRTQRGMRQSDEIRLRFDRVMVPRPEEETCTS